MRCCSTEEWSLLKDDNVAPSLFSQVVSDAGTSDAAAYYDNSGLIVHGWVSLNEKSAPPQGDRKGPIHSSSLPPPLQRHVPANARFVVFVRAGVGWCGAGTLAVNTSHLRTSHQKCRGERIKQLDKIKKLILRLKGLWWRHLTLFGFVFVV